MFFELFIRGTMNFKELQAVFRGVVITASLSCSTPSIFGRGRNEREGRNFEGDDRAFAIGRH